MNTKKNSGYGTQNLFCAIAVMLALAFIACETPIDSPKNKNLSGTIGITPSPSVTTGTELTAVYSGTESVSYQWNKGGTAINGEKSTTFTPLEAGSYTVTVSAAGYNSITSTPVSVTGDTLQILSGAITIEPNTDVRIGTELTATYSGEETVTYQWKKGGVAIEDATSNTFTPSEEGSYTVTVSATGYVSKTSAEVIVSPAVSPFVDITYTATQTGGENNTTTSTGIVFTFSASIDDLGLTAADITVGGTASKGSATLTGSGTSWTLSSITVNNAGLATVKITKTGIEAATKDVIVHKEGEATPEYWTITWNMDGGAAGAGAYPTQIVKGAKLTKPSPNPTKDGIGVLIVFVGWYTDSDLTTEYDFDANVTANLTLYAKWEFQPTHYTIFWEMDGGGPGTGGTFEDYPYILRNGDVLARPPDPTKDSYTFGGWYTDPDLTQEYNFGDPVTTNLYLYAKWAWTDIYYSITWDLQGGEKGTGVYPEQIENGAKLAKPSPDPTKDGYIFKSWYFLMNGSVINTDFNFSEQNVYWDMELQAYWEEVMNKPIIWNLDGGEKGAGAYPDTITKGYVLAKPSPDPTKAGYIFGGWYTDSDLTTAYNFSNAVNVIGSLTLYAKWIVGTPGLAYTAIGTPATAYSVSKGTVTSGLVVIPATHEDLPVTTIADFAFQSLYITGVTIGENVTTIGQSAFNACYYITSITIPAGVTSIGQSAFNGCSGLTSITIPASVTSIDSRAFTGCSGLTSVTFEGTIASGSFSSTTPFPGDLRDKYLATPPDGGPGTYTTTRTSNDNATAVWTKSVD